jgi:hypothetical protein
MCPNFLQELKDEAMAIRLTADLASKRALEDMKNNSSVPGSSRQRIRDILQKQREEQEKRSGEDKEAERKVSSAFDPTVRSGVLWVFR